MFKANYKDTLTLIEAVLEKFYSLWNFQKIILNKCSGILEDTRRSASSYIYLLCF